jgi:hypothetical protein
LKPGSHMRAFSGSFRAVAAAILCLTSSSCTVNHCLVVVNLRDEPISVSYPAGGYDDPHYPINWMFLRVPKTASARHFKKTDRYTHLPSDRYSVSDDGIVLVEVPPGIALMIAETLPFDHPEPKPKRGLPASDLTLVITTTEGTRRFSAAEAVHSFSEVNIGLSAMFFRPVKMPAPSGRR